jgi:hypothetical protein
LAWIIKHSERRHMHGLPVALASSLPTSDEAFAKLSEALELVRRHDARAFRELVDHTRGVFVFATTGGDAAEWWRDEGLVVLSDEYVTDESTASRDLAVVLVHEATHVWLERHGFEYTIDRRTRLEEMCHRRELRLARRLPDAEELVGSLVHELRPGERYFTDEAFYQRAVAQAVRQGVPAWLVRQIELWSRIVHRLSSAWSRR